MPLLVRRINRAKWEQIDFNSTDDVSADTITNCLRTFNNELSVWKIENMSELDDAILALITGSKQSKLRTLHYVIIDEALIIDNKIDLKETNGDTVVGDLVKMHKDITALTYVKLGIIKDLVIDSLLNNRSSFFTRAKLKGLIKEAMKNGRVSKEELNKDLVVNEKL